jgi:hypothetical protein
MENKNKTGDAQTVPFKRLHGVSPDTFKKMLSILQREYDILHQKGGKPPKLTVEDKLCITLKYLRAYRTMDSIAADYGVCKGTVCLSIQWVEDRRHVCLAREKEAQEEIRINSVRRGRCYRKPDQSPQKEPKRVLFGKKTAHAEDTGHH